MHVQFLGKYISGRDLIDITSKILEGTSAEIPGIIKADIYEEILAFFREILGLVHVVILGGIIGESLGYIM